MNRFWLALERVWGLSASRLCWQQHLGDENHQNVDLGRYELLVATNQLAKTLPVIGNPYEWLDVASSRTASSKATTKRLRNTCPSIDATWFASSSML